MAHLPYWVNVQIDDPGSFWHNRPGVRLEHMEEPAEDHDFDRDSVVIREPQRCVHVSYSEVECVWFERLLKWVEVKRNFRTRFPSFLYDYKVVEHGNHCDFVITRKP